uniref:Uncharacterized protein n=1 Tax=Hyaloperonospora arabidopsidis (strain Emoy2) TaxID=559515 RepID=M4BJC6_HYAAE
MYTRYGSIVGAQRDALRGENWWSVLGDRQIEVVTLRLHSLEAGNQLLRIVRDLHEGYVLVSFAQAIHAVCGEGSLVSIWSRRENAKSAGTNHRVPIRMLGILLDVGQFWVGLDAEHVDERGQQNLNVLILLRDQQRPFLKNDKTCVIPDDGGRDGVCHDPPNIRGPAGSTILCHVGSGPDVVPLNTTASEEQAPTPVEPLRSS